MRDNRFDNLKGIMIFLVLIGHFIESMYASWQYDLVTRYLDFFIYLFHMPVFVFISGFFSKKNDSDRYYRKTMTNCLIPYLLFNFIYGLIDFNGSIGGSIAGILYPKWTLWFLLSLFMWRLMVKPFSMLKGAFWLSVLLSLYTGFTRMDVFMSLSRTFCFFPFFLGGYLIPEQFIEKIRSLNKIYAVFAFLFAVVSLIVIQSLGVEISALHMSIPYGGTTRIGSVGERLLILVTGFVCIAGFVLVISDKASIISMIGRNSIIVYLIHSGILRALIIAFPDNINNGSVCVGLAVVFSVIVCLLFGNEFSARVYHAIMARIIGLIMKHD